MFSVLNLPIVFIHLPFILPLPPLSSGEYFFRFSLRFHI